jgi:hypothetical protein
MEQSILKSVKKILGIDVSFTHFDFDIITHINTVFATLNQLGIGPEDGFMIEDDTAVWTTFLGTTPRWVAVKSYVYLKVRMLFDPPTTSFHIEAMNKQAEELEYRLLTNRELTDWTSPTPIEFTDVVLDGGDA